MTERFRSPWMVLAVLCGTAFALLGVVMLAYSRDDIAAVLLGAGLLVMGAVFVVVASRAGVRVDEAGVLERPLFGVGRVVAWAEVSGIAIVGNEANTLPSRVPVLITRSGGEIPLTALAFYGSTPRRVRRLREVVERHALD
ncbi:hypothetical protein [Actinokineospora globicatena]|uniref:hypothetical protein n=1 Tax=Actinokineospora globicatena TaxID=103729 RepID=UPI0020A2BBEE|nr:hypothetical protein [Actinokineospora globicatena]MCP2303225.1 hypothetical protein [Actinokineospora globicatena]GLW79651.1 hypothetical protein Aglo01_41320 [Actinokineospora globicatena]GLW85939.1 hypothetical protein Aglo02_35790 [Actinokineospora globicatena]